MGRSILGRLGFVDKGNYDNAYNYSKNDFVSDGISTYFSMQNNNKGHALTETDWWKCMAKGQAVTGAALLSELLDVDGDGSKLDADMLDGHHWTEITEPSEVADFDFFLGVKSLGEGKGYGIQKMSKQNMASVLGELLPIANSNRNGLIDAYSAANIQAIDLQSGVCVKFSPKINGNILIGIELATNQIVVIRTNSDGSLKILFGELTNNKVHFYSDSEFFYVKSDPGASLLIMPKYRNNNQAITLETISSTIDLEEIHLT